MKTIIKNTTEMAEILGISERAVRYRLKRIRIKACDLNKRVQNSEISRNDSHRILKELKQKRLAGYNYEIKCADDRAQYTFYKNV